MKYIRQIGRQGEELAAAYLRNQNYQIIERNWRHKRFEIDIVARSGNMLVFVEVKSRTSVQHGFPEEFVDDQKISCMMDAAEAYLLSFLDRVELRFDIISVLFDHSGMMICLEHFQDAFYG